MDRKLPRNPPRRRVSVARCGKSAERATRAARAEQMSTGRGVPAQSIQLIISRRSPPGGRAGAAARRGADCEAHAAVDAAGCTSDPAPGRSALARGALPMVCAPVRRATARTISSAISSPMSGTENPAISPAAPARRVVVATVSAIVALSTDWESRPLAASRWLAELEVQPQDPAAARRRAARRDTSARLAVA